MAHRESAVKAKTNSWAVKAAATTVDSKQMIRAARGRG
jgi:hypothetical protein